MIKNGTQPMLLQKLFELLKRRRVAFVQERTYWRVVGMVLGEIFNFGGLCRAGTARTLDVLICSGSLKPYRV